MNFLERDKDNGILILTGLFVAIFIGGLIYCYFTQPPPKSLEEIRAERIDKFHEAGKDGQAFLKGLVGK
jgi:hypothetical protein